MKEEKSEIRGMKSMEINNIQTNDTSINIENEKTKSPQNPVRVNSIKIAEAMIYDHCLFRKLVNIEFDENKKRVWYFYNDPEVNIAFGQERAAIIAWRAEQKKIANSGDVHNTESINDVEVEGNFVSRR